MPRGYLQGSLAAREGDSPECSSLGSRGEASGMRTPTFRPTRLLPLAIALLLAAAAGGTDDKKKPEQKEPPTEKVVIGAETFKLEIAAEPKTRIRGLMERTQIDDHGGMIFVFRKSLRRSFWMKNCLVDIDLVFLDRRGGIVALHKMKVEPPRRTSESARAYHRRLKSYPSRRRSQFAIELKAGSIDRLKLKRGQTIELDFKKLKKLAK